MNTKLFLVALALFVFASPIFAQTPMSGADEIGKWVAITSGFSMAIASGLCGLAQAKAVASSAEAMARNPGQRPADVIRNPDCASLHPGYNPAINA